MLIAVGVAGHVTSGFEGRLSDEARTLLAYRDDRGSLRDQCDAGVGDYLPPAERCTVGADTAPTIAVVGDSHARELAYFLGQQAGQQGRSAKVLVFSSCPPILGIQRLGNAQDNCPRNNHEVLEYLRASEDITHIVLAARWTLYLEVDRFDNGEGGKEHGGPFFMAPVGVSASDVDRELVRELLAERLFDSVGQFLETGKTVVVVYPVPEVGWNVPEYLARADFFGVASGTPLSTAYERYRERNAHSIAVLDSLGEHPRLRRVRPAEAFCNTVVPGRCIAQRDGIPLYFDDDHLNSVGSAPVVEQILRNVDP